VLVVVALIALLATLAVDPVGPAAAGATACAPSAGGTAAFEQRVFELMNEHRAARGLRPLAHHDAITATARAWSTQLAAQGVLAHDPGFAVAVRTVTGYAGRVGENVARSSSADAAHRLFVASASHRATMERVDWTRAGVGVVVSGGSAWVTVRFADGPVPAGSPTPGAGTGGCAPASRAVHESAVARLYEAYLGRAPDRGGLDHWVGQLAAGVPLERVATAIAGSSELVARTGVVDDAGFVRFVYRSVLRRDPDPGGLAHWTRGLATGRPRGWVLASFTQSSEYRAASAYPG